MARGINGTDVLADMAGRMSGRPRLRLTAPIVPENDIHVAVARALDLLLMPPATWTCFPAGNVQLSGQAAAKLTRMGLKRGWPDILVLHGAAFGIELKRLGGKLSRTRTVRTKRGGLRVVEGQQDVFPRLQAAGMQISTCESVDEVLRALANWGVPLRVSAST